jgi:hypothetical protein
MSRGQTRGQTRGLTPGLTPIACLAYDLISYCSIGSWRLRGNGPAR